MSTGLVSSYSIYIRSIIICVYIFVPICICSFYLFPVSFSCFPSLFRLNNCNLVQIWRFFALPFVFSAELFLCSFHILFHIFLWTSCIMSTTNASSIWMSKSLLLSAFSLSFDFVVIVSIVTHEANMEEEKIEFFYWFVVAMQHNHSWSFVTLHGVTSLCDIYAAV